MELQAKPFEEGPLYAFKHDVIGAIRIFSNPLMKSTLFSYELADDASVKIELFSADTQTKIKSLFYITGNSGGRKGINKVLWDGSNQMGIKVIYGTYYLRFIVGKTIIPEWFKIKY